MISQTVQHVRNELDSVKAFCEAAGLNLTQEFIRKLFDDSTVGDSDWGERPEAWIEQQRSLFVSDLSDDEMSRMISELHDDYDPRQWLDSDELGPEPGSFEDEATRRVVQ